MPAPHHSVFTGQLPFLTPNQQHQSTEGKITTSESIANTVLCRQVQILSLIYETGEERTYKSIWSKFKKNLDLCDN